jgi:hypothetical protein
LQKLKEEGLMAQCNHVEAVLPKKTIKRHIPPPPIKRPPGQFQEEEPAAKCPTILDLSAQVRILRAENERLRTDNKRIDNRVGEFYLQQEELKDEMRLLRTGLCYRMVNIEGRLDRFSKRQI